MTTKTVKYRVVSFPWGGGTKFTPAKTYEDAQRIAKELSDFHPIVERNTVTETGWEIEE